ncbi:MAG TPA: T9SS type A sorting domain-containing protein, partial [Saprospiraceae bacterium]|nr:T9SS type A sorting domain-containing protein [Saprospiraceae bacterium]
DPDTLGILGEAVDFPVGLNTVTYYATDDCGQQSSCSFIINVLDQTAPTAVCAPLKTVWLGADGTAELAAAALDGGSVADSCNVLSFRARPDDASFCLPETSFSPVLHFCCTQAGDTVTATLRAYDFALPAASIVADSYGAGHFSDCTVQIVVADTLLPSCTAPPDTMVDCTNYSTDFSVYGTPLVNCRVDSIAESVDFQQFDIYCNKGTVVRTFTAFSNGVAGGQCSQTIQSAYHQKYYIRFPDDVIVTACNGTNVYGSPMTYNLGCEQMSITYEDEVFTIVPDACYKIERTWLVVNSCTYDSLQAVVDIPNPTPNPMANNPDNLPGPVVSAPGTGGIWASTVKKISFGDTQPTDYSTFWAADANGYRYKQIIKIVDTAQPEIACPGSQAWSDTTLNDNTLWNESYWLNPFSSGVDLCEGEAPLSVTATDACSGSAVELAYQLFLDLDGDDIRETVVQSSNLPASNTIYYYNAGNPNYSGGVARAFDERSVPDNQKYRFAIDKVKNGNEVTAYVRWDTQASPASSVNNMVDGVAPLLPLGTHKIRWIAYDLCGNTKACEFEFTISGTKAGCMPPDITIGGKIETILNSGVGQVAVALNSPSAPSLEQDVTSIGQGFYYFPTALPLGSNFSVVPYRNDNASNGISTFDIVLLSKHILGIDLLNSPYKIIAADINHSNSVTTFDVIELRKLVLGIYSAFPANTSWRFVPKEHTFSNPQNPFFPAIPDSIKVFDLSGNSLLSYDFVGIKIGDLNLSAAPGSVSPADERSGDMLWFDLKDKTLAVGETVSVAFRPGQQPAGFQFTLEYPGLTLLDIVPEAEGLGDDNFAVFEDAFTTSWNGDQMPCFSAVFQAETPGRLRDMLRVSDRITNSEAYWEKAETIETGRVGLHFDTGDSPLPRLFGNLPNPFADETLLSFFLPEPTTARLCVYDQNGRLVWQEQGTLPAGNHQRRLRRADLGAAGMYTCELTTPDHHQIQKMILLDR